VVINRAFGEVGAWPLDVNNPGQKEGI